MAPLAVHNVNWPWRGFEFRHQNPESAIGHLPGYLVGKYTRNTETSGCSRYGGVIGRYRKTRFDPHRALIAIVCEAPVQYLAGGTGSNQGMQL